MSVLPQDGLCARLNPFPTPQIGLAIIVAACVELSLLVIHPAGFWWNAGLSGWSRVLLAAIILVWWTIIGWASYWYIQAVGFATKRIRRKGLKVAFFWVTALLLAIVANLYLACWIFFWRLGVFPDLDALYFTILNRNMLVSYFWQAERMVTFQYGLTFTLVTLVVMPLAAMIGRTIVQMARPAYLNAGKMVLALVVGYNALWIACDMAAASAQASQRPQSRIEAFNNPWPPFDFEFRYHTSPSISLLASLMIRVENELDGEIPLESLTPIRLSTDEPPQRDESVPKRSIILITIESLRSDALLEEHQGQAVMPNVGKLASSGHFFTNCYSQSTHSDYSDPCILSSLYPLRTPQKHFYQSSDPWPKVFIYELLKKNGYATAIFSSQNEAWSNMDLFYDHTCLDVFFDSRAYNGPTYVDEEFFREWQARTGLAGKLNDAVTMQKALDWIESQHRLEKPFFVSLNLQTSHFPYEQPFGGSEPFQPSKVDFEISLFDYSPKGVEVMRNRYFNALHFIDIQIGRLMKYLEARDLDDETILIITGDNGEAFHENGEVGHAQTPLETTTKVGLVFNCPEFISPSMDHYLAESVDIAPTTLALVGISPHPNFQGENVLSMARTNVNEQLVFIHCRLAGLQIDSVLSGTGWKYVYDHNSQRRSLYFRPTDLNYHANLADTYPEVASAMDVILEQWRRNQLLYYRFPRYYNWFYPPHPPQADLNCVATLRQAAARACIETNRLSGSTDDATQQ